MTDEYYDIDFQQKHPTVKGYWVQADKFTEMYRKATALDKIRDEIKHLLNRPSLTHVVGYDKAFVDGIDKVLQIIDKHMKGEQDEMDR